MGVLLRDREHVNNTWSFIREISAHTPHKHAGDVVPFAYSLLIFKLLGIYLCVCVCVCARVGVPFKHDLRVLVFTYVCTYMYMQKYFM